MERIPKRSEDNQTFKVVIPVIPASIYLQEQVDLRRGGFDERHPSIMSSHCTRDR